MTTKQTETVIGVVLDEGEATTLMVGGEVFHLREGQPLRGLKNAITSQIAKQTAAEERWAKERWGEVEPPPVEPPLVEPPPVEPPPVEPPPVEPPPAAETKPAEEPPPAAETKPALDAEEPGLAVVVDVPPTT